MGPVSGLVKQLLPLCLLFIWICPFLSLASIQMNALVSTLAFVFRLYHSSFYTRQSKIAWSYVNSFTTAALPVGAAPRCTLVEHGDAKTTGVLSGLAVVLA